jgi:hypothetical protein
MRAPTVILVEGLSDQHALEALSRRRERDLPGEGVDIVAMGGARNIRSSLERYGPQGLDVNVRGLCDAREEPEFRRALERTGFGANLSRRDMEALGFFVCVADLEDELIRALGVDTVEQVISANGELELLRALQRQPAQRDRTIEQQLHRFMGTKSGRKLRYARLLVDALDLARVPRPLELLLESVPTR